MGVFAPHVRLHANPVTLPSFNMSWNIWQTYLQCRPEASLANPCILELIIQEDMLSIRPKINRGGDFCVFHESHYVCYLDDNKMILWNFIIIASLCSGYFLSPYINSG